jgi:hypothetical protein
MAYTKLIPHASSGGRVDEIEHGSAYRLTIPSGIAGEYRVAQLDDYAKFARRQFPHRGNTSLTLSARTSGTSIPGTWGFGLWNDPFGLTLGFGGNPFRLPALPNSAWFFGASKESHLSFTDKPGNGFLAQTFKSPWFHPILILAGLEFPFSRRVTRRLMGRVIAEDGVALDINVTQWHRYSLEWRETRVSFEVNDVQAFESPVSPNPPLGLVIWIDNQYAAFTPEGKIRFGVLENPEPAWLEVRDVQIG